MTRSTTAPSSQAAPASQKRERRACVRLQSNAKGSCQSLSMQREADWQAMVRDISCTGIGLLLPRRFEPGSLLAIELTEATEGRRRLLLGRVARAEPQPDGNWLIGCTMANPLTEDEVRLLIGNDS